MPDSSLGTAALAMAAGKWLQKTATDNIGKYDPLLWKLKQRGQIKPATLGGTSLYEPLMHAFNTMVGRITDINAAITISKQAGFTNAEYKWSRWGGLTAFYRDELLAVSGEPQMLNLVKERTEQTAATFIHQVCTDAYADGTGESGTLLGLNYALDASSASTNTVGGISPASATYWRHQGVTGTEGIITTGTCADGIAYAINKATFDGRPDLVITTLSFWQVMVNQIRTLERFVKEGEEMANAGFTNVLINNVETVWSRYMTEDTVRYPVYSGTGNGHAFILNTNHIKLRCQGGSPFETATTTFPGVPGIPGIAQVMNHYMEIQFTLSSRRAHARMYNWHHA